MRRTDALSPHTEGRLDERLRACHPLTDHRGDCALVYDLERTFVIGVPRHLQSTVGGALARGNMDAAALRWLRAEGLITDEPFASRRDTAARRVPRVTDVSLDMSGACNMGCLYCFEREIKSRIGPMSDEVAEASLEFAFGKAAGAAHVVLHFGSGEPLIRFDLLQRIVASAKSRALSAGQVVSFELTTNASLVTRDIAAFLRDEPFNVRVSCDGPAAIHNAARPMLGGQDSYAAVERGLALLLEAMPKRVTVNTVIAGDTRLRDCWSWAKRLGVSHYHVIKVGTADGRLELDGRALDAYREDLALICDDMQEQLAEGRIPLDFQPITKIVRRLMIPEPITRFCGVAGSYLGISSNGEVFPCFRHLGLDPYRLGNVWDGVDDERRREFLAHEAADVDSRPVCQTCWARYLCGGGCYADSTVYRPETRDQPVVEHCPFWRAEIESAIRFFDRLRGLEPEYCLRLFGDDSAIIARLEESEEPEPAFLARYNCA